MITIANEEEKENGERKRKECERKRKERKVSSCQFGFRDRVVFLPLLLKGQSAVMKMEETPSSLTP